MWIHAPGMDSSPTAKKCLRENIAKTKEVRGTFLPAIRCNVERPLSLWPSCIYLQNICVYSLYGQKHFLDE